MNDADPIVDQIISKYKRAIVPDLKKVTSSFQVLGEAASKASSKTSEMVGPPPFWGQEVAISLHSDPRIAALTIGNAIFIYEEASDMYGGMALQLKLMELEEAWCDVKLTHRRIRHILRRWFNQGYYEGL